MKFSERDLGLYYSNLKVDIKDVYLSKQEKDDVRKFLLDIYEFTPYRCFMRVFINKPDTKFSLEVHVSPARPALKINIKKRGKNLKTLLANSSMEITEKT